MSGEVHIHAPKCETTIRMLACSTCKKRRKMRVDMYEWYDPTAPCGTCGGSGCAPGWGYYWPDNPPPPCPDCDGPIPAQPPTVAVPAAPDAPEMSEEPCPVCGGPRQKLYAVCNPCWDIRKAGRARVAGKP